MLAKRSISTIRAQGAGERVRRPATSDAAEPTAAALNAMHDASSVPEPASAELQAVARALKGETDRLVEKMVDMIHQIPEYRLVKDPSLWNEVRQILRVNTPVFYSAVIEGRVASDEERSAARYFARRRAHQGVPLRGHLTAYRNGMWMLWAELVARVLAKPKLQKELLLRAAWAFRHLETISSEVTEAYLAEQEGRARHRDRTLRDLFEEIINGSSSSDDLRQRAEAVGLKLDTEFKIVVIWPAADKTHERAVVLLPSVPVAVAIAESTGLTVEQLVAIERTRELILIAATRGEMSIKELRAKLSEAVAPSGEASPRFFVGISGPVSGIEGVRQGYKEARRAVEIGQMLEPSELAFFYEDYVLQDVLDAGAKAGRRLVCGSLGALLNLGETGRRLIDTLEAYFRAGAHLKVAAALLDIHPNTLAYRMRQIHRLTGLNPENPEDRLRAEIAIRLLSLHRRKEEAASRSAAVTAPKSPSAARRSARTLGA